MQNLKIGSYYEFYHIGNIVYEGLVLATDKRFVKIHAGKNRKLIENYTMVIDAKYLDPKEVDIYEN